MNTRIKMIRKIIKRIGGDHIGAYAAQSALFLMISMIPIILLLLLLIRYTAVTRADVMVAAYELFPVSIRNTILYIINEVYSQTKDTIPVTIIVAVWSAGRCMLAITRGLNVIYRQVETRNYIYLRIRSTVYTVFMILAVAMTLVVLGFGNHIHLFVKEQIPALQYLTNFIIELRALLAISSLAVLSTIIYCVLPNAKNEIRWQIPGAVFNALGWTFVSFVFSIYVDIFKGFSDMYGSLTTIVLIMMWLYFCMYSMLLGGEFNVLLEEYLDNKKECGRI